MGARSDGEDSVAYQVEERSHWKEIKALILVVSDKKKGTASTEGMQRTVKTSQLLQGRIRDVVGPRMERMEKAIRARDFDAFARETMADSNSFHAVCLDTVPPIFYLNDVSRGIIRIVEEINRFSVEEEGGEGRILAAYTFDAGPNAVVYCEERDQDKVEGVLRYFFPTTAEEEGVEGLEKWGMGGKGWRAGTERYARGEVSRFICTEVGDGPRVCAKEESLLGVDGFPKSLRKE